MSGSRPDYTTMDIGAPTPLSQLSLDRAAEVALGELHPGHEVVQHKKFEIVEPLGEGGMGRIYRAYDPSMDRYIALKILKPDVPELQSRRFHREAVIAANFSHPNLVRVLEVGQSDRLMWMAMEYLRGRDVGDVIARRKPVAFRVLVDIFDQVLDALHYIHLRKIVHCDIKPENIFITRDAYDRRLVIVKLIDFGIARSIEGPLELQTHLTGDPRYMSPEQSIINKAIDGRTDLYALGLTFFEVATCRHPFEDYLHLGASDLLAVQCTHVAEAPSRFMPKNTPPALAAAMDAFFARACAKAPEDRYPTALAMQRDLRAMLERLE